MEHDLLRSADPPLESMMAGTHYFEVQSHKVGATFGVWVTTPVRYDLEVDAAFPVIYVLDGNWAGPSFVPSSRRLRDDPIHPIQPFIQVSIGYCGADVGNEDRIRNRDLRPPGEPVHPAFEAMIDAMASDRSIWKTVEDAEAYKESLHNPCGDAFLAFIVDELHPAIQAAYRIDTSGVGLFGYSYGGLFAAWTALQPSLPFTRIGAGSPGINTPGSAVFKCLDQGFETNDDYLERELHITICELEITAPTFYQQTAQYFGQFAAAVSVAKPPRLTLTSRIIANETHFTGMVASWWSFLRACYSAQRNLGHL